GASRTPPLEPHYWDLGLRLKAMNRSGVAVQALSLTAPMVYCADAGVGTRLCGAFNDAVSAAHTAHPDRFVGCAALPLQDTERALGELARAARLPGIRGVYIGANAGGRGAVVPARVPGGRPRSLSPHHRDRGGPAQAVLPEQPPRQSLRPRHRGRASRVR